MYLILCAVADHTMMKLSDRIAQNRRELQRCLPGNIGRAQALYNLAGSMRERFEKTNAIADINEAIALHRQTLDLRPTGHQDRCQSLVWLAWCLRDRYLQHGWLSDLEEAITLDRAALELGLEGHPNWLLSLHQLAVHLSDRYDKQASVADLEEAITLGRTALEFYSHDHSNRAPTLYNLADNLRRRFLELGATADIDEAISLHRSALDFRPEGHPKRSTSIHSLALCLSDWYYKQASVAEVGEPIMLRRAALELRRRGHTDPAITLYSLGNYLRTRCLKETSVPRSALDLPLGHTDRSMFLNQLASCLGLEAATLDDKIIHNQDLHPPGHDGRLKSADGLLLHLRKRCERLGMTSDLDECITLGRIALGLRKPRIPDHTTYSHSHLTDLQNVLRKLGSVSDIHHSPGHTTLLHNLVIRVRDVVSEGYSATDADEIVAVVRAVLKLCPPGHSDRTMSLTTLATCLQHRFEQQGAILDVDEAIILHREVLEHCPSGSPDSVPSLHNLACCLQHRFAQQGAILDVDEAIILHREVLKHRPSESPDSAPFLHKLACCLSGRFIKLFMTTDLDDAIKCEQLAFSLYLLNHPDRAKSFGHLTHCRQLRVEQKSAAPLPGCPLTTGDPAIKQLIATIAFEVLKAFPPRLLQIENGTLCDRDAQITHFEKSPEYKRLVLTVSDSDRSWNTVSIRGVVEHYFRYVTLSHRWGKSEPLLRHIEKQVIYDLDTTGGFLKLQSFCLACCQHTEYLWAWSDTCCIDKDSSAEVHEAIGSMFSWYRRSALTVVYLADVSDGGVLTSSEWFERGWTLQELLAPRTLLFFTQQWAIYRGIPLNHKKDSAILVELEKVTGISSWDIADFHPGVTDARLKLHWASTRHTTRPEDIAYSLFGVFGLHLPVLYGESAENALGRLLVNVISQSGDTSVLDWVGQSSAFHSCLPATIVPYQSLPSQLLPQNLTPPLSMGWFSSLTFRAIRKMHQALSRLTRPQFINSRLILPCIIHHIDTIVSIRVATNTAAHVHRIKASGLEPIEITLSKPLEYTSRTEIPYILIRPRHSNLLEPSVMTDDASACRWLTKMQKPFSALLLQELFQNEYKRVVSFRHIIVHPTDSAGVLKGEVTTLTIV